MEARLKGGSAVHRIVQASAFLVDVPVESVRTDAVQSFLKQETIFVRLSTDDGLDGLGYSYTIGTGGTAVLAMLNDYLLPALVGEDSRLTGRLWHQVMSMTRATTPGVITSLAVAAIDLALWDIRCLRADQPLWIEAGGFQEQVPMYDTEGGWLHLTSEELAVAAKEAVRVGWQGVKVKVGKPDLNEDLERLRAVRAATGPDMNLMLDANQFMTYPEAKRRAAAFEEVNPFWFEEPLPPGDVSGHARLAASTSIPIAVGESLYSLDQFRQYLESGAASIVQVDVSRIGGITPWLKVAHTAESYNVKVAPHFLMEIHVSLVAAVSNGLYVEHIPQLRSLVHAPMTIEHGFACAPSAPGLGIDWDHDALDRGRVG